MSGEKDDKKVVKKNKRTKKIKNKLLLMIMPTVCLSLIILFAISAYLTNINMTNMAVSQLEASVDSQGDDIESWLKKNLEYFSTVKKTIETLKPDDELMKKIIYGTKGMNSDSANGMYMNTADGKVYSSVKKVEAGQKLKDTMWYKEGITRVNMGYGEVYNNAEGIAIISATGIIDDGSGETKVIGSDVSLNKISIIVNSKVKMDGAYAFLVDKDTKTILADKDNDIVSKNLGEVTSNKELYSNVSKKIDSEDYSMFTINNQLVCCREISGTDWLLVSYIDKGIILKDAYRMMNIQIIVGIVATIVIIIFIRVVVGKVIAPISIIADSVTKMSSGDFTVNVESKSNDEIGLMSEKVAIFIDVMREMINNINKEAIKLSSDSENSSRVSIAMNDAAQNQAEAMKNLNNTVDQLAVAVNEIAENATTLAMVVADTRDNSDKANQSMKDTVEISKNGREEMERLNVAMSDIKAANNELVKSINDVGTASEEITKIVGFIAEIAEETNLLSLNASIEAARAGEAGKGFAVVASEIGNLANNSSESAENIAHLIEKIRELIDKVVHQADVSAEQIDENSKSIDSAVKTFGNIYENIQSSNTMIDEVIRNIQKVEEVATNVAAISEEQAASTDEILDTSTNMVKQANNITESSQEVAVNAEELAKTSENLTEYVNKFKI